jgi:hypothetical protein
MRVRTDLTDLNESRRRTMLGTRKMFFISSNVWFVV